MSHIKTWKERKGLLNTEPFRPFIGAEWEMQAEIDELRAALAQPVLTVTVQQAWEWAGGNPGIKATADELREALQMLDQICDDTDVQQAQPDCRTCDYYTKPNSCWVGYTGVLCTNGDKYEPAPPVVLWRTE